MSARLFLLFPLLLCALLFPAETAGQEEGAAAAESAEGPQVKREGETVEFEPYTGPPIYLPQGEDPPEPTVVESRVITEKFPESEAIRFERGVVRLSDNSVVSDGPHKEYYSNSQLFAEGAFDRGKPIGAWTFYHENGELAKSVTYKNGKPEGEVRVFGPEGKLKEVRSFADGVRDGEWRIFAEDGEQVISVQRYTKGKADGEWRTYYKDGQQRQITFFKQGKRDGLTTEWNSDGKKRGEVQFKDGQRDGKTVIWQRDGAVVETMYEAGKVIDQKITKPEG